jgi:signal transduction histidine kinase
VVQFLAPPNGFRFEVGRELPRLITWRVPLEQVFTNLLSNAVAHHHRGEGRIAVRAFRDEDHYLFEVSDDGPGIPHEHHATVVQVFQVLAARDRTEHTGMGLALVKKLVESHDGDLWLDSAPGGGTTVRFSWPLRAAAPASPAARMPA